ncbi:hypothetical protein [Acetonema longum]|uniref:Transcriptional regulator n=1 Tax=Acetonema longum DSM 6540 TaxID=1009370 RepID=F7NG34_9FIRM|nr:hypothetical protein [Acetonema longum]EGO64952.1 hypothetical protein ALO_05103 [Acetonema longum DSM 6540]
MIRLALVGPLDSVRLIQEVAAERRDMIEAVPMVYQDAGQVAAILAEREREADVWLFSGKVPYSHAMNARSAGKPFFYIPHTGTSLYRALLQITYIEKKAIESISFDTFSRREIEEAFADIELQMPSAYINYYEGIVSAKEMTEFHYDLWQNGKIQAAVTCFLSTYLELKEKGVPAFRIWPTRENIRMMLDIAVSASEAIRFKLSQIAVQIVEIDGYGDFVRDAMSAYAVQRVEIKVNDLLVDYAERVRGSTVTHGNGRYVIYSTRGIVDEVTRNFTVMPLLEEFIRQLDVSISGGIGFGTTAHAAEKNAHIALGLARRQGRGKWMVVLDDRSVVGPLNSATHLRYDLRSDDAQSRDLAQRLGISVTTLNRLLAAVAKLDKGSFAADDLALYLSMTTRNARRLLAGLVEQGLASVTGEEAVTKGRPRKLYTLLTRELTDFTRNKASSDTPADKNGIDSYTSSGL